MFSIPLRFTAAEAAWRVGLRHCLGSVFPMEAHGERRAYRYLFPAYGALGAYMEAHSENGLVVCEEEGGLVPWRVVYAGGGYASGAVCQHLLSDQKP